MRTLLITSIILLSLSGFWLFYHPLSVNAVPFSYNQSALVIPWTSTSRSSSTYDTFLAPGNNDTITAWYRGTNSTSTINLQLGSTLTPTVTKDAVNNTSYIAVTAASEPLNISVVSNQNRMLLVDISYKLFSNTNHNLGRISTVKIGSTSLTLAVNKTITCGINTCDSEIWYQSSPNTGFNTITVTPTTTTTYGLVIGAYDISGISSAIGATSSNSGNSTTPSVSITPTHTGAWIFDSMFSDAASNPVQGSTLGWRSSGNATLLGTSNPYPPNNSYSNTGNVFGANVTGLTSGAKITAVGINVANAAGDIRLKVYQNDGAGGGPSTLLAETGSIASTATGWQYYKLPTPATVPASGIVWLVWESDSASFSVYTRSTTGFGDFVAHAYGPGPSPFGAITTPAGVRWSLQASQGIASGSQYNTSPTISNPNTLSWTTNSASWASTAVELFPSITQPSTINLPCSFTSTAEPQLIGNGSNLYFVCTKALKHFNVLTDTTTHDFTTSCSSFNVATPFWLQSQPILWCSGTASAASFVTSSTGGNVSQGASSQVPNAYSNENIGMSTPSVGLRSNSNTTITSTYVSSNGFLTFNNTSTVSRANIDTIAFDPAIPAKVLRYWNGMAIRGTANYNTNSSLPFYTSIQSNTYKNILTLPDQVLGITDGPSVHFILHSNTINYMVVLTTNHVYYYPADTIKTMLTKNYAVQNYIITTSIASSLAEVPNPVTQTVNINGPNLNTTNSLYGFLTLPSGYNMRVASSGVRTIDPRWTNSATNVYPVMSSTGTLFPIFLTVNNAPTDAGLLVQSQSVITNSVSNTWSVVQLDASHSAEFDLPPGTCANISVGDISVSPVVYLYQGNICATGVNQKTIQYTNTLPLSFYTMTYAASSSYTPSTNGLAVTTRSTTSGYTENIIIKNSTGAITQNYTAFINSTLNTHTFNVTNATKPASLYVSIVGKGQIYTSYLGSSLSFASVVSFFHQYLSYQGFDLIAFIPIIFASMFTRNTVGIGAALTVVVIATMSWLSVEVVSDTVVGISIIIAIISMIGYRAFGY